MKPRYLTKSRFKLALECPTKLFYTKNPDYADQGQDDPFMQALANGGYQVGEMAKYRFVSDPVASAITVDTLDEEEALRITQEKLMSNPNVVIAEGAFRYKNLFIRADIIVRDGNTISLYEVKSKSISKDDLFFNDKGKPNSAWQSYLYDIAFQTYVMQMALQPRFTIKPHLLLINKDAVASRDGLNQLFKVSKDENGRTQVTVPPGLTSTAIGNFDILRSVPMSDDIAKLHALPVPNKSVPIEHGKLTDFIHWAADLYENKARFWSKPGMICKSCTFYKGDSDKKCGFSECWAHHSWSIVGQVSPEQLNAEPLVTELWLGKGGANLSQKVMEQNVPFVSMLEPELIRPTSTKTSEVKGMTPFERRSYQIEAARSANSSYVFLKDEFLIEKEKWDYPLNMIDFETSTVALPYFKGMAPYETVAFQFSHHLLYEDGRVEHYNDFISWEAGKYPNLEFVRALKASLESNEGSIFRYADHENSVLNKIKDDIAFLKPADMHELIEFIDEITQETIVVEEVKTKREGRRNMIDLANVVRSYYYSPHAGGSNSIKRILPAIIHDCPEIADLYSQPDLYGKKGKYSSRNFDSHIWIDATKGRDPYKTLPALTKFDGVQDVEIYDDLGEVADGSAAMTAYNKLQWSYISDSEREALRDALLRYCELDTLAMVMLVQGMEKLDDRAIVTS